LDEKTAAEKKETIRCADRDYCERAEDFLSELGVAAHPKQDQPKRRQDNRGNNDSR
jgi:hypothetical protein